MFKAPYFLSNHIFHTVSIFLIFSFLPLLSPTKISFNVIPYKKECIGEYITEETVVIFGISSSGRELNIFIRDNHNKILYEAALSEARISFTAEESGDYVVCLENKYPSVAEVEFEFLSGVEANDFSEVAKEDTFKPAEHKINELTNIADNLIVDLENVDEEQENTLRVNDTISSSIITLSITTIAIMIIVGVLETAYIQRYLQNRKLI